MFELSIENIEQLYNEFMKQTKDPRVIASSSELFSFLRFEDLDENIENYEEFDTFEEQSDMEGPNVDRLDLIGELVIESQD